MNRYACSVAQEGFAAGEAFVLFRPGAANVQPDDPASEAARLERAIAELSGRLSRGRADQTPEEAAIADAEIQILQGADFAAYARSLILEEGLSASQAVSRTAEKLSAMLASSGNEYIRARGEDVRGLSASLSLLLEKTDGGFPDMPCILVADELSPAQLLSMPEPELIRGILTCTGSRTSHVSVLAGNSGIPYLYGLEMPAEKVRSGDYLILDTEQGCVLVNPPEEERRKAEEKQLSMEKLRNIRKTPGTGPATRTRIFANISGTEKTEDLLAAAPDGIGLFRSEFLFMDRDAPPSEEEQYQAYRRIAEAMQEREVTIRTMDIGSDKKADWLKLPQEANPALGLRGLRVQLEHRDLFRVQLRALLRAAACGHIRIMVPMIASLWEVEEVQAEIGSAAAELEHASVPFRIPELGVMIETPAAVMIAPELAGRVRFFSIGTNDLTQYTLAVDREAQHLERYADPQHEAVFRMIRLAVDAAHEQKIPVAVCGELAGRPGALERLIRLGVDELSVSVAKISAVRQLAAQAEREIHSGSEEKHGIYAPAEGELVPMADIPDPVFSGGTMGECVGILSEDGKIYAPFTGTVSTVARTGHAISFSGSGEEVLVHVGIDTVQLKGEGFHVLVREGDSVQRGQLVMEADCPLIRARGLNPMVIVVRLNTPKGR